MSGKVRVKEEVEVRDLSAVTRHVNSWGIASTKLIPLAKPTETTSPKLYRFSYIRTYSVRHIDPTYSSLALSPSPFEVLTLSNR